MLGTARELLEKKLRRVIMKNKNHSLAPILKEELENLEKLQNEPLSQYRTRLQQENTLFLLIGILLGAGLVTKKQTSDWLEEANSMYFM